MKQLVEYSSGTSAFERAIPEAEDIEMREDEIR